MQHAVMVTERYSRRCSASVRVCVVYIYNEMLMSQIYLLIRMILKPSRTMQCSASLHTVATRRELGSVSLYSEVLCCEENKTLQDFNVTFIRKILSL
jgi:hypothetical protein